MEDALKQGLIASFGMTKIGVQSEIDQLKKFADFFTDVQNQLNTATLTSNKDWAEIFDEVIDQTADLITMGQLFMDCLSYADDCSFDHTINDYDYETRTKEFIEGIRNHYDTSEKLMKTVL